MKFSVHLIDDAEKDLLDIYQYAAMKDSMERAGKVLDSLERTVQKL